MNTPLHIVGRFDDPHTGAERSLPDLADALAGRRPVHLWSDVAPHPFFVRLGVQWLDPSADAITPGGDLLIGGVHVQLGPWLEACRPARVTLRYNLPNHLRLFDAIARIRHATGIDPVLVFVSATLQASVGLPGRVEPSLIRLDAFLQNAVERPDRGRLTVGRVSRDVIEKHDPGDVAIYRMLAARGVDVRILGGLCLRSALDAVPGVTLLPAGAEPVEQFLAGLDIFFYRTGSFTEPYGRVVLEAMAAGLPVVAASNGGYAEQIHQGRDGFLVRNQDEALRALQLLVMSPETRQRVGSAARARALLLHGPEAFDGIVSNYAR
ncbi:MAG: glycosyltransferase [Rhodoferax sp.]|nr:glycosyltransferase [Rhodoferax sp.]